MNKAYLLVFETSMLYNYPAFHEQLTKDYDIKNWWHYITSAYIVISPLDTNLLTNKVMGYMPNNRFIIYDVTAGKYNGWLQQDAWDWIAQYTK